MLYLQINGRRYPVTGSGLTTGASRVVLDLRRAAIFVLYPDGSAGFWGIYQTEPNGAPDRETAVAWAHFLTRRGIPLGLADTELKYE